MASSVIKRSVVINGHKTSVSLEDAFWAELKSIANEKHVSVFDLISKINRERHGNLSSALRLFVLAHHRPTQGPISKSGRAKKASHAGN